MRTQVRQTRRSLAGLGFAMVMTMSGVGSGARAADCGSFDQDHAAWTALLSKYVEKGSVDYTGWKRDGRPALDAYLASLAGFGADCFARLSREQQMALLINAYNANTVRLILDNLPIESIRKIGFLPGSAFRRDFITLPAVGKGEISLDDIEHGTLRKKYADARIHFALVCAARSCPPLRSEAYRGAELSAQLDDQGRAFLGDASKNRWDAASKTLFLSRIFEWFEEDFVKAKGGVTAFVAPYLPGPAAKAAVAPGTRVEFLEYDWSLNGS
jgi:hypothetical protein